MKIEIVRKKKNGERRPEPEVNSDYFSSGNILRDNFEFLCNFLQLCLKIEVQKFPYIIFVLETEF